MTFLNSIFLAALAAVIIPLLIHFLSRKRIKIIDFSSLKFLFQMQKSKLRWLRILEILLLILRMTILALIALAFARPAFTGKTTSSHAPASVVVLIDNSPSMETLSSSGIVFNDVKNITAELIDMLKPGDEITLIPLTDETEEIGPYSDFDRMRTHLYTLQTGYDKPLYNAGLKKAAALLNRSNNLNREIYIVSDLQAGDWWEIDRENIDPAIRYFLLNKNNNESENIGFTKVEFPPQLLAPGEEFSIKAHIRNYSDKAVNSKLVELFIDEQKKVQTAVDIKPYGSQYVEFLVATDRPGVHKGYFQLEDDDYSTDNRFFFNYDIPRRISILGVGGNSSDVKTMQSCFGDGYLQFTGLEISGLSRTNLSAFDVIVLNNIPALSDMQFNSLTDFVLSGGGLFIVLGSSVNPEAYKQFLMKQARIDSGERTSIKKNQVKQSYYPLNEFNLTHPVFSIYEPGNQYQAEIPDLKLFAYIPLSGGIPLANLDDGKVVMAHSIEHKVLVSGFGFDRASSDIAIHSFIVPLMIRSVEYLALKSSTIEEYFISGDPVSYNLPGKHNHATVGISHDAAAKFIGRDPAEIKSAKLLKVSRSTHGAFVSIARAGYPGFYAITAETDTLGIFSVNHDSLESETTMITESHLKNIFNDSIEILDMRSDIEPQILQAKFGREIWAYLLAAALLLLIIESALVRKAMGR